MSRTFSYDKGADPEGFYGVFADPELRDFALNTVNKNQLIQASSDLKLANMYSFNGPDLTPLDGSPAATGSNFDGENFSSTFFTTVTYRGAVGQVNWAAASNWAVWK